MNKATLIPLLVSMVTSAAAQDEVIKEYRPDGSLSAIHGTSDERAWFVTYHPDGQVKEQGRFYRGLLDGTWKQFNEKGELVTKARFVDGKRHGRWKVAELSGRTMLRLRYRDNVLVRGEQFDQLGELVAERDLP
jgi:antitoxin component YwqK of YwqJK toxin-antitoxin module